MNASLLIWPSRRNSFHPTWLLVPVPPLIHLIHAAISDGPGIDAATLLQFLLGVLWIAPWVWWRSGSAPGWVVQGLKEIRGLLPALLLATLGPSVGAVGDGAAPLFVFTLFIGCLLMAVGIFASEFENRTLSTLLGQPCTRSTLYGRKLAVLALLFIFVSTNALLSALSLPSIGDNSFSEVVVVIALLFVIFASAPLFALLTRATIAGATFTVAVPLILYVTLIYAQRWYYLRWVGLNQPPFDAIVLLSLIAGTVYVVVCGVWSWRTFLHLEAADSAVSAQTPALLQLGRPAEWLTRFIGFRNLRTDPLGSLVRKELRLQSIPWIVALLMTVLAFLVVVARVLGLFSEEADAPQIALIFMSLASVVSLLGTGATCVAEERQIGSHDWQLTQPASLNRQWRVKIATTLVVGIMMGLVWPLFLLRVSLGFVAFSGLWPNEYLSLFLASLSAALVVLIFSSYASSYSRSTLKAGVSCIATILSLGTLIVVVAGITDNWQAVPDLQATYWFTTKDTGLPWVPEGMDAVILIGSLVALFVILGLALVLVFARFNHRQSMVAPRTILRQHLALLLLAIVAILTPGAVVYGFKVRHQYILQVANLAEVIDRAIVAHRLPPNIFKEAGLGSNATTSELAMALLREHGVSAFELLARLVTPPPWNSKNGIDPALARRYGLRLIAPPAAPEPPPPK